MNDEGRGDNKDSVVLFGCPDRQYFLAFRDQFHRAGILPDVQIDLPGNEFVTDGGRRLSANAIAARKFQMAQLRLVAGPYAFDARLEVELAPETCAAFEKQLPFLSQIIHVRWSGEGVWMPLGDHDFGVGFENNTCYPAPGQVILYPGGVSETEILLAYGNVNFASKAGQLSGNHFMTLTSGTEKLYELGRKVLWEGAQDVRIELI
jgi:Protein of unknown function (DUF3830)